MLNIWDILVILLIALALAYAIHTIRSNKHHCSGCQSEGGYGCNGSCANCSSRKCHK